MRFTEEEKLTIIAEGQKAGARAICAKYAISDQTYRAWRYKAQGIKPRKLFSLKKKLKILEEGARDGIYRTCAAYDISLRTYYNWRHKLGFVKLPRRGRPQRVSEQELPKLAAIITEGQKTGVRAICAKYDISDQTHRARRYKAQGIKPRKLFSLKKKLKILEEGARHGIYRICAAYDINPTTYYNWRHKLGFSKLPRQGRPERFSNREKLAILEEGYKNGILRACTAYGISSQTYYHWKRRSGYCRDPRRPSPKEERRLAVNDAIKDGIAKDF